MKEAGWREAGAEPSYIQDLHYLEDKKIAMGCNKRDRGGAKSRGEPREQGGSMLANKATPNPRAWLQVCLDFLSGLTDGSTAACKHGAAHIFRAAAVLDMR